MLLSRLLADFTRGESDMLRKAMGKKQIETMNKLKVKFLEGGQKNGHAPEVLEKIWADWEKFASYAFNKSHATCYTWVAYQTAYLKANYPAEYMAGVLSRNLGNADKLKKIMDECIRMGINVKGPDINESIEKFSVNKKGEIRFGLGAVKGVGANAVGAIVSERNQNGPFKDIYDFVERVNLSSCNRASIENLALAGSFDSMGYMREIFVEPLFDSTYSDVLVKYGQLVQNDKNSLQASLFGDLEPIETAKPPIPRVTPWNNLKLLDEEKKLVTIYLSAHPLDPYFMELTYGCNCGCGEFEDKKVDGAKLIMGGLVTDVVEKMDKTGNPYARVKIEDFTGTAELMLFRNDYRAFKNSLNVGEAVTVSMQVNTSRYRPDRLDVKIDSIAPLESLKGKVANSVTIYLDRNFSSDDFFKGLYDFETQEAGGDLFLEIYNPVSKQIVTVHSRKKFLINKKLVDYLAEWNLRFKIGNASNY